MSSISNNESVYFVSNNQGQIKIGYSRDVKSRVAAIRSGCPFGCKILRCVSGGADVEAYFHQLFVTYRLQGEWFALDGELKDFVNGSGLSIIERDTIRKAFIAYDFNTLSCHICQSKIESHEDHVIFLNKNLMTCEKPSHHCFVHKKCDRSWRGTSFVPIYWLDARRISLGTPAGIDRICVYNLKSQHKLLLP